MTVASLRPILSDTCASKNDAIPLTPPDPSLTGKGARSGQMMPDCVTACPYSSMQGGSSGGQRTHVRKEKHVTDRCRIGQEHHQPIDSDPEATGRGQPDF